MIPYHLLSHCAIGVFFFFFSVEAVRWQRCMIAPALASQVFFPHLVSNRHTAFGSVQTLVPSILHRYGYLCVIFFS